MRRAITLLLLWVLLGVMPAEVWFTLSEPSKDEVLAWYLWYYFVKDEECERATVRAFLIEDKKGSYVVFQGHCGGPEDKEIEDRRIKA